MLWQLWKMGSETVENYRYVTEYQFGYKLFQFVPPNENHQIINWLIISIGSCGLNGYSWLCMISTFMPASGWVIWVKIGTQVHFDASQINHGFGIVSVNFRDMACLQPFINLLEIFGIIQIVIIFDEFNVSPQRELCILPRMTFMFMK